MNFKRIILLTAVMVVLSGCLIVNAAETAAYECTGTVSLENIEMPGNDELFSGYVSSEFYPEQELETNSHLGEDFLSANDKAVYEILKAAIEEVAAGKRESTVFDVGYEELAAYGLKTRWTATESGSRVMTDEAMNKAKNTFQGYFDVEKVFYALLEDCPYELYWFDKTGGISYGLRTWTWRNYVGLPTAVAFDLSFNFLVEKDYQPEGYDVKSPKVDLSKTSATTNAVTNALNIIYKYHTYEDYEKIEAYKNEICALTSYDRNAVSSDYTGGYGDPWQMIYVFDGNPETNVVCEGYSKAFQYLMDNSVYESRKIECRSVSGWMYGASSGGAHMWNVVTLDDGLHYLADITNSDTGTVGACGDLFLVGGKGNAKGGYTVALNNGNTVKYYYDSGSLKLWGDDENCPLTLFANQYIPHNLANADFAERFGIKTTETDEETVLEIIRRTDEELPVIRVFSAVYEENGRFKGTGNKKYDLTGKKGIKINISKKNLNKNDKTRLFIWTENLEPVTK